MQFSPMPSAVRHNLPSVLLIVVLSFLWIAGGASRYDALGQVIVRTTAWIALIALALVGRDLRFFERGGVAAVFLLAAIALPLAHLIPLPPSLWTALPGRRLFAETATAGGVAQPWRPLSIAPAMTLNALSSLVVPLAVAGLMTALDRPARARVAGLLLAAITASALIGLAQASGIVLDNPFINDVRGLVSGSFANRNHFAVFLAIGCVLAPTWAFVDGRQPEWRAPFAVGLVLLFALTILATGSRAGILVGAISIVLSLLIVMPEIRKLTARLPRWAFPALIGSLIAVVVIFVLVSMAADRAAAIDRAFASDPGQDMRARGLPVVLAMIRLYFPVGSGLGSFDAVFRIHEPTALLKPSYFNHAHNDLVETVLEGGLAGLVLLFAAAGWWMWSSVRLWRRGTLPQYMLAKAGSAILLIAFVASLFDYPARTPMIMAVIAIASVWLAERPHQIKSSALPHQGQHL